MVEKENEAEESSWWVAEGENLQHELTYQSGGDRR